MHEIQKEMLEKNFGGVVTEIVFTTPKKVLWQDETNDQVLENVVCIDVIRINNITSIKVNYNTEKGDGSLSTSIENIKKLVVLD